MNIDKLGELAAQVADEHHTMVEAFDEETAAQAALLEAVIAKVRPALRALTYRIGKSFHVTAHADVDKQRESETLFDETGFLLAGDDVPREDNPRDNRGDYEGAALYLMADGRLVEITYDGNWSRWQGSEWGWESTMSEELTAAAAMQDYDVEECIESVDKVLRAQLAGRKKRNTKAAQERATKLRALAELIR